jgi:hypothetical protein
MRRWVLLVVFVGLLAGVLPEEGSAQVAQPDASVGAALENLASRAATVFAGQVISIQRHGGVVEIVFRVDVPVAGQVGSTYTLREWAGMWPPGQWRYTVGERAMVFLHASSQAGLSSAVDGGEGVVPLVPGTDGTPLLDVRRLSTRVLRQVGQPLPDASVGAISLADATQLVVNWRTGIRREPARRPLPPGLGVVPRRTGQNSTLPTAQIHLNTAQRGRVAVLLQESANAAN